MHGPEPKPGAVSIADGVPYAASIEATPVEKAGLPSRPEEIGQAWPRRHHPRRALEPGADGDQRRAEGLAKPTNGGTATMPALLKVEFGEVWPQPVDPLDAQTVFNETALRRLDHRCSPWRTRVRMTTSWVVRLILRLRRRAEAGIVQIA